MNRIKQIKAAQVAAAEEQGKPNPYGSKEPKVQAKPDVALVAPERTGRMARIKAAQMAEAEKTGIDLYAPKQEAKATAPDAINDLAHYQAAMEVDLAKVANQKDLIDKARVKQALLPTYLPFVEDYVESGDNYPNTITVQVMIWLLDIVEIEHGFNLALHLIKQGQKMPAKIKRDMPTFLCDMMYDWANATLKEDQSASPYLDTLAAVMEQEKWDIHPLQFSKIYSMLAKHKVRLEEYAEALVLCEKAEAANPEKSGVKGLKADIEKILENTKT